METISTWGSPASTCSNTWPFSLALSLLSSPSLYLSLSTPLSFPSLPPTLSVRLVTRQVRVGVGMETLADTHVHQETTVGAPGRGLDYQTTGQSKVCRCLGQRYPVPT